MPELIEVELYRSALDPLIGQPLDSIHVPDAGFLRPKGTPSEILEQAVGQHLESTSRHGKLLMLHLGGDELTIGLRFGMTGRLVIDGSGPIEALEYASAKNDPKWDRVTIAIGGANVSVRDQRRLGSIELDPDTRRLGPEASTIDSAQLTHACAGRSKAIKAVLLDQNLIAGLGNLLVDETLWQIEIDPTTPAGELSSAQIERLAAEIRATISRLSLRGGSHTGDSFELRAAGAICARCDGEMVHGAVGGRSTWWCAAHQR